MSLFHLFHLFIDWSELVGVACLLVGVVGLCFFLFCLVADQSLRSSCLPMTNLAQLHDCHSCYDERSIDQKKNNHSMQQNRFRSARQVGFSALFHKQAGLRIYFPHNFKNHHRPKDV